MKLFLITFIFYSSSILAEYSKPKLLARFSNIDPFNAPAGLFCYSSDPLASEGGVFLSCKDQSGQSVLVRYRSEFEILATSKDHLLSRPIEVNSVVSWYEFNEVHVNQVYEFRAEKLEQKKLKNLGPLTAMVDSFLPQKGGAFIYRLQDESKHFYEWKTETVRPLYTEKSAHLFPPVVNDIGEFIFKRRKNNLSENAPDELLLWDGSFQTILRDQQADPHSTIKSFRHQCSFDQKSVALVVTDQLSEVLVIIENGKLTPVARVGEQVKSFDYFSPKLKNGILAFRGNDLEGRKTLWVFENGHLKRLLTQGDVIHTDKGLARVDYNNQDALFFSSPGISKNGDIFFQVALTDLESPRTLLGIGLIELKRE